MSEVQQQQPPTQGEDEENKLVERVFSYAVVKNLSNTLKGYYDYAKTSNYYVKASLETAESYSQPLMHKLEEYSHQPTIESLIHRVDQYACKQLDKIEHGGKQLKDTYEVIKPKTMQSIESAANKIHRTPVEAALFKTVEIVDVVVDSLLPCEENKDEEDTLAEDPNIIDVATPVITKLKARINKDSLRRLPSQTYHVSKDIIFRNADAVPQLHYCIGMLSTAAHRVRDVSSSTQAVARNGLSKGAYLSKTSAEYVYVSLQNMVGHLEGLVLLVKRLDPIEARASLEELTAMIQTSKEKLSHKYGKQTAAKLKDDISQILQKAGEILSQQVAAGYSRIQSSDNAAIKKSIEAIDIIVVRILESFSNQSTQDQGDEAGQQSQ